MRSYQFKTTCVRRGHRVHWHLLDRIGSGVIAQGQERTKTAAVESASIKQAELARRYLPTSSRVNRGT